VKQTYRVVSGLIALGVVIQAMAIAMGGFTVIGDVDNGKVIDNNYQNAGQVIHSIFGLVIPLLGLILLIVSFFAAKSVPGARQWAGIVFGVLVLQVALAAVAFSVPAIGALHGINALVVLGTSVRAFLLTREGTASHRNSGGTFDVPQQASGSSAPEASRRVI
jgi:heme A synthase